MRFKGVAGSFYLRDDFNPNVLLVATRYRHCPNPLDSHQSRLVASLPDPPLFCGVHEKPTRPLITRRSLKRWQSTIQTLSFVTTLSRRGNGWTGMREGSPAWWKERVCTVANLSVYLCGNGGVI